MRVGGCITLHAPRLPTFRSGEYAAGNRRGKSEASERTSERVIAGENEKRLSSTWIGSGAEKEFPAGTRRARTRRNPLRPHLALSPHDDHEIRTRSLPPSRPYPVTHPLFSGTYANSQFSHRNKRIKRKTINREYKVSNKTSDPHRSIHVLQINRTSSMFSRVIDTRFLIPDRRCQLSSPIIALIGDSVCAQLTMTGDDVSVSCGIGGSVYAVY